MKKLMILSTAALLITGVSFANEGGKEKKEKAKKARALKEPNVFRVMSLNHGTPTNDKSADKEFFA